MSRVEAVYRWLSRDRSRAVDHIWVAALEHAEPPYADEIAGILLKRRNEIAWAGLVADYPGLPAAVQQELRANPELLRAALAAAMTTLGPRGRANALTLLAEQPCPQLAYLVADVLRDPDADIRAAAAAVLCCTVEQFLSCPRPTGLHAAAAVAALAMERAALAKALREALRTFELHQRQDVLELCLWFAKDLGESLWESLCASRSATGHVVARQLKSWNHPRLAAFLLLALARPAWRPPALELLGTWNSRHETLALLQNSDLLADLGIRRNLHLWKHPRWLALHGSALAELPREARARFPLWACHVGLRHDERLRYLMVWQASPLPEVRRAAVYALASLNAPEATRVLAEVATRSGPMQQFARWFILGQEAGGGTGRQGLADALGAVPSPAPQPPRREVLT